MSTSDKELVSGLPKTDEESSRSYFTLSKHRRPLLPPTSGAFDAQSEEPHRVASLLRKLTLTKARSEGAQRCLPNSFP